jgi:hypothetical protein
MKLQSLGLREWHLFWREEVCSVRSQEEAMAVLGAGPERGRVATELLREAGGAGAGSPEDVARMLTSGELLLIRHAAARHATAGLGPMLWKYPQHGALSEFGAQSFLRRFTNDPLAVEVIRRITQHRLHTAFHESLSISLLFAAAARWIAQGELVVAFRMFSTGGGPTADVAQEKPAPEAPAAAPPASKTPEPEVATFPPDHDASIQAQALTSASEQGVPFCEECMRAAMQQASGN